jgi:hypothetical protein
MEAGQHFELFAVRRLAEQRLLPLVFLATLQRLGGTLQLDFFAVFQPWKGDAGRLLADTRAGHHGEIAGSDMFQGAALLLDPDADLKG